MIPPEKVVVDSDFSGCGVGGTKLTAAGDRAVKRRSFVFVRTLRIMVGMRVLIIGGTRLSGPFLVRHLLRLGHRVMLFHRGNNAANVAAGVEQIIAPQDPGAPADRYHLASFREQFAAFKPDVVIHMIAYTRADAEAFV